MATAVNRLVEYVARARWARMAAADEVKRIIKLTQGDAAKAYELV